MIGWNRTSTYRSTEIYIRAWIYAEIQYSFHFYSVKWWKDAKQESFNEDGIKCWKCMKKNVNMVCMIFGFYYYCWLANYLGDQIVDPECSSEETIFSLSEEGNCAFLEENLSDHDLYSSKSSSHQKFNDVKAPLGAIRRIRRNSIQDVS